MYSLWVLPRYMCSDHKSPPEITHKLTLHITSSVTGSKPTAIAEILAWSKLASQSVFTACPKPPGCCGLIATSCQAS